MKKALIVIDYVNDFVDSAGALTCGEPAQAIEMDTAKLIREFQLEDELIVAACDCHAPDDKYSPEAKLFPPHCLVGTWGAELYREVKKAYNAVCGDTQRGGALWDGTLWINKTRYSAFAGTCLDIALRERGVSTVHLAGVCTDICVLHTAVDAYNLGYKVVVHQKCVASFNQQAHEFALAHMKNTLGATII